MKDFYFFCEYFHVLWYNSILSMEYMIPSQVFK